MLQSQIESLQSRLRGMSEHLLSRQSEVISAIAIWELIKLNDDSSIKDVAQHDNVVGNSCHSVELDNLLSILAREAYKSLIQRVF